MLFVSIVSSILLIYCLLIKIGHHTVSFNRYLALLAGSLWMVSFLDLIHLYTLPLWMQYGIVFFVMHAFVCVCVLYFYAKKRNQTPKDIDLIFVFGAGLIQTRITLSLKKRLLKAKELASLFPNAMIIVSGGQGKNEAMSEAQAMEDYLVSLGVEKNRIHKEDQSTSTQENLVFSMDLYPLENKKIALISNQFHVYRTEKMARKLKLNGVGVPAYMSNIGTLAFYIREYLACVKAFLKREI